MTDEHPETGVINKQINRAIFIIVSSCLATLLRIDAAPFIDSPPLLTPSWSSSLAKIRDRYPLTTISAVHDRQVPQAVEIAFNDGFLARDFAQPLHNTSIIGPVS
jgi:hypothetical protein